MAKHKVSELSGALLDAAVAKAEGHSFRLEEDACVIGVREFRPSETWQDGGPIIEREQIAVVFCNGLWRAWMIGPRVHEDKEDASGPTPLIAAMRAYVDCKFGDEVELP